MRVRRSLGVALLEVLVSILILALFLLALLPALIGSVLLGKQNSNINIAAAIAKERMEIIRVLYEEPDTGAFFPVENPADEVVFCALGQTTCYATLALAVAAYPARTTVYRVRTVVTESPVGCWFNLGLFPAGPRVQEISSQAVCYETQAAALALGGTRVTKAHKQVTISVYMNDTPVANNNAPIVASIRTATSDSTASRTSLRTGPLAQLRTIF